MESKKPNKDGLESKDAHIERPLLTYEKLTYEKLTEIIKDVLYSEELNKNIFKDDTSEFTLEELYTLRDKGFSGVFQIGGMWTGIGGAIEFKEALIKEIESWKKK